MIRSKVLTFLFVFFLDVFLSASPGRLLLPKITEVKEEKEAKDAEKEDAKEEGGGEKGKGEGGEDKGKGKDGEASATAKASEEPEHADDDLGVGLNMLTQTPECAQWLLQVAAGLVLDAASAQRGAARAEAQVRRASVEAAAAAARATKQSDATTVTNAAMGAGDTGAESQSKATKMTSAAPEKPNSHQKASISGKTSAAGLPSVSLVVCPGATAPGETGVRLAGASDAV